MFRRSGFVWFIDAAYILKASKTKVNYLTLREHLEKKFLRPGERFDQCIFYNSYEKKGEKSPDDFHAWMIKNGFDIKLFPLKKQSSTCLECSHECSRMIQKGVDVALSIDMLGKVFRGEIKGIVLTAGDRDFVPAIEYIKSMWRPVYLSGYRNTVSEKLQKVCDKMLWLN